jgi:hypothetical protein
MATTMTTSKKGKALLIALLNLNAVFFLSVYFKVDSALVSEMITSILYLAITYVGVQGGVDFATTWKSKSGTTLETKTD